MKLLSWNVNGIRAAAKKGAADWIKSHPADIICMQEVKATLPEALTALELPNNHYHIAWNDAKSKKGYSGVATLSSVEPITTEYGIGVEEFDREGRIIISEFDSFYLFNLYFPNSQRTHARLDYKLAFNKAIHLRANALQKSGKAVILCGDFNVAHNEIDLKNPKTNHKTAGFLPEERAWMSHFLESGYTDTFRATTNEGGHYSWWSYRMNARERNIGWRIDYFIINSPHKKYVKNAFILNQIMGSDHCPVGIELTFD